MKEVAYILNISARTVACHKYRMMDALGAKTYTDLVRWAIRNNMIAA
jgi:DNA-binding CsgD family transcriptional regulator